MGSKRMQGLRFASSPRVWAKSRQHGPTNYHGPPLQPKPGGRMRRLKSGERPAPGAAVPILAALALAALGSMAGGEPVYMVAAGIVGSSVFAKRGHRLEYLGFIVSLAFFLFLGFCVVAWIASRVFE